LLYINCGTHVEMRFTIGYFEMKLSVLQRRLLLYRMRGGRRAVNATPILLKEDVPSNCASNYKYSLHIIYFEEKSLKGGKQILKKLKKKEIKQRR